VVVATTGHPVSLGWAFAFHFINDLGFANVLPVGLALYSRAAPKGLLDTMSAVNFWMLHVALMLVSAAVLFAARYFVDHILAPSYKVPAEASA
jgi:proton-dependent oligopeptide transporter, POT family